MTDQDVIARHQARLDAAKARAEHKRRLKDDKAYRAAEKIAGALERYGASIAVERADLTVACGGLAVRIRASVAKPEAAK